MKTFILLFAILTINAGAQRVENNVFYVPTTFQLNQLSGSGFSSITGNSSNFSSLNPAALNSFNKISAGVSYQYETNLKEAWIADIGNKRINKAMPQSAGIVFPYGNLRLALGMNQVYNGSLDLGKITITTAENPDGTVEYFEPKFETLIYNYSLTASYSFNAFGTNNLFGIGLQFGYNHIERYEELWKLKFVGKVNAVNFAAGLTYDIRNDNNRNIIIGLSYNSGLDESGIYKLNDQIELFVPHDSLVRPPVYYYNELPFDIKTPAILNAGVLYNATSDFSFTGDFSYILWKDIEKGNNEPRISGSVIYSISEMFKPSIGFLYSSKTYEGDVNNFFDVENKMSAFYLTLGLVVNYYNFYADAAIADSHLAGGEWRKHTIGKFTLGYSL